MAYTIALGIGIFTAVLALPSKASADRAPMPETTICNKTKQALYVATTIHDTYVGWNAHGWTYIKPKQCSNIAADAFYFRGTHTLKGVSQRTQLGCVTYAKVFNLLTGEWTAKSPAQCKERKGHVVTFVFPKPGRTPNIDALPLKSTATKRKGPKAIKRNRPKANHKRDVAEDQ